jgi:tetratricopeptide (TPR) repeat protein
LFHHLNPAGGNSMKHCTSVLAVIVSLSICGSLWAQIELPKPKPGAVPLPVPGTIPGTIPAAPSSMAVNVYRANYRSVVKIFNAQGSGTGFIIDKSGWILTNAHVISLPPRFQVEVEHVIDGKNVILKYHGVISAGVKLHKKYDLAMVKIDPEEHGLPLHPVTMRDTAVTVGETCFAIGHPLGNRKAITNGIVSAIDSVSGKHLPHLQSTVTVQGGNSGGPLLDAQGRVIAVIAFFTQDDRGGKFLAGCVPRQIFTKEALKNDMVSWRNRAANPALAEIYLERAEAYDKAAQNWLFTYPNDARAKQVAKMYQQVALTYYQRAISADPKNPLVYRNVGWIYLTGKQPALAEQILVQGIVLDPAKAEGLYGLLAWSLGQQKKYDDAKAASLEGMIRFPESAVAWSGMGYWAYSSKNYDEADYYAKVAGKLQAKNPEEHKTFAKLLQSLSNQSKIKYDATGEPEQDNIYVEGKMKQEVAELQQMKKVASTAKGKYAHEGFSDYMLKLFPPPRPRSNAHAYLATSGKFLAVGTDKGLLSGAKPGVNPKAVLTAHLVQKPSTGQLSVRSNGAFSYIPEPKFVGKITFTYKVKEGKVDSVPKVVTINIFPKIDPPAAQPDSYASIAGRSLSIKAEKGVLSNDKTGTLKEKPMSVQLVTGPKTGQLKFKEDGSFVYMPRSNFSGNITFTYRVIQGQVQSDPATVTVFVASRASQEIKDAISVAKLLARSGQKPKAIQKLRQIISRYPKDAAADEARGMIKQWGG